MRKLFAAAVIVLAMGVQGCEVDWENAGPVFEDGIAHEPGTCCLGGGGSSGGGGGGSGGGGFGPTGQTVQINTTTTGDDLDADGYVVVIEARRLPADSWFEWLRAEMGINDTRSFHSYVPHDRYHVFLEEVAPNCSVQSEMPIPVPGSGGTADFEIFCEALP